MRAINTNNWYPILYRFEVIADYCLNFGHFAFLSPLIFGERGQGLTQTVHLRFIAKLVVDFLFVLIELFSLDITAEALQANIDWTSAFLKGVGQFRPNFHAVGDVPREPFLHE